MTESIESRGRTVEEAISEALLRLGARRDEVEIEVVAEPRTGLFGFLGGRSAKVVVTRKSGGQPRGRDPRSRGSRGRGRERSAAKRTRDDQPLEINAEDKPARRKQSGGRSAEAKTRKSATQRQGAPPQEKAIADGTEEPTRRRRSRRRKPAAKSPAGAQPAAPNGSTAAGDGGTPSRRANDRDRDAKPATATPSVKESAAAAPAPPAASQPPPAQAAPPREPVAETAGRVIVADVKAADRVSKATPVDTEKVPELLQELTTEMMQRGKFLCRCEVVPGEYHLVKVVTDDRSAGMLIGRHGATIDAVEHIVERMATQSQGSRVRMNLDINNYRRKREATLIELTEQAIAEVRQTGREVYTDPLCARERRIVHLTVKQAPGIKSSTMMSSDGKYVVLAVDDGAEAEPDTEADEIATGAFDDGPASAEYGEPHGGSDVEPKSKPAAATTAGGADRVTAEDDGTDAERHADL